MPFPGAEQAHDPRLSRLERLYVRLLGVPVNGLRIRLRHVLPATSGTFGKILDAGCGIGVFTMELAKQHPAAEVLGVDLDEELVDRAGFVAEAAGIQNCHFARRDVTDLGFREAFDLVLSVDNLEHVEDDVGALRSIFQALRPGGRLVVHTPGYHRRWLMFGRRVNFDVPGHVRPGYRLEELVAKLRAAGFRLDTARHTYGILETFTNNVSYLITGAERRNKGLYSVVFPFLLGVSYVGRRARPRWGAGVLATAHRPSDAVPSPDHDGARLNP